MSFEYLINHLINLDPYLKDYLQPLAFKTVAVSCCEYPEKILYCKFEEQRVQLSLLPADTVDAEISGPLYGLLMLAIHKQNADLRQSKVVFSGDLSVAQALQQFMFQLNIDWEEELSKYTGDVFAHSAVSMCKKIKSYSQYASTSLESMITEYLQEESGLLPTSYEIKNFLNSVDELRLATDRLEAKLNTRKVLHASD